MAVARSALPTWASTGTVADATRSSLRSPLHSLASVCHVLGTGCIRGVLRAFSFAALPLLRHRGRHRAHLTARARQKWVRALVPELLKDVGGMRPKVKPSLARVGGAKALDAGECNHPEDMPQIEVVLESPFLQRWIWRPDQHASLKSFLQSIDLLKFGYDISRVKASFDGHRTRCSIKTVPDLREFLSLDNRGPLYIRIPEALDWQSGIAQNLTALKGFTVEVGRNFMSRFMQWLRNVEIDEETIRAQEEALKSSVQCEEFRAFGEVCQYEGIDMKRWSQLISSLKEDGLPPKVINGLVRASVMRRLSETCFDLDYKDGKLRSAFLVRLLTMKVGDDKLNAVMFHYQLRFVSVANEADGLELALTPEQALAIERYVDQAALLKWKEKLQIDTEDADAF